MDLWQTDPMLSKLRNGDFKTLNGLPHPRCVECSPNILAHELNVEHAMLKNEQNNHGH